MAAPIPTSQPATARELNARGLKALEAGDAASAARLLEQAARLDPKAPALWMNLAKAQRALGEDAAERAALEQALGIDRRHVMAHIRLAELHERQRNDAAATDEWSAVLALARSVDEPSTEFAQLLEHARAYVSRRHRQLEDGLSAALSAGLDAASSAERRRVETAVAALLGRRPIYANHCHGLHYPFLPADEFYDREHFPWLAELEAATPVIRAELEAILAAREPGLAPYIAQEPGTPENLWTPLDRSLDWGSLHLWLDGERVAANTARAPQTAALVETLPLCRIPGRAPAVFFSILKAGATIPPHTGVTNVRTIVHLPLIVPDGCAFRVGGETRRWVEGEAFAFDDTIEHEAWNPSGRDRAVLILDVWNPHLSDAERAMILQIYAVQDAQRTG